MTVLALLAVAFYGVNFNPAQTNAPSSSRIYPVRFGVYRMIQPDGQQRSFQIVDSENGHLAGKRPWVGVIKKNRIDVWADPDLTDGRLRTGFTFINGQLRVMKLDGQVFAFPTGNPKLDGTVESLFPERKARAKERGSSGDIWTGERFRLWFANPNSAGLLMAQLLLVALALGVFLTGRRRAIMVPLACLFTWGLLAAGSRGAQLATIVGGLCLLSGHWRKLLTLRGMVVAAAVICLLSVAVVLSGQGGRIIHTFTSIDAGNMLRLKIAKAAAMMFADSPFGWSGGEVPGRSACLNWYVFDEGHVIRTHLLTLAELGWFKGAAYVFFWFGMMFLSYRATGRRNPLPLALWSSFFLAGFLNPVYTEWELWLLPIAAVALSLRNGLPSRRTLAGFALLSGGVGVLAVATMAGVGTVLTRPTAVPLQVRGPAVLINGATPKVWVVEDQTALGGAGFPGREILTHYVRHPDADGIAYVQSIADLPDSVEALVLPGRAAADFLQSCGKDGHAPCRAKKILFLSPSVGPSAVPEALVRESKIQWVVGYFAALRNADYAVERDWVSIRLGAEIYLPNWMSLSLAFDS